MKERGGKQAYDTLSSSKFATKDQVHRTMAPSIIAFISNYKRNRLRNTVVVSFLQQGKSSCISNLIIAFIVPVDRMHNVIERVLGWIRKVTVAWMHWVSDFWVSTATPQILDQHFVPIFPGTTREASRLGLCLLEKKKKITHTKWLLEV